ncbi:hypothetical protein GCM10009839_19200 [Catenulispora yoronensis]|uniref:histidine kinase n=1 Tax=Catenulispora yoronensis TaxID=450799 RepID=A0ABN2TUU7_9ACTN
MGRSIAVATVGVCVLAVIYAFAVRRRPAFSLPALGATLLVAGAWSGYYAMAGKPVPGFPSAVVRIDDRPGPAGPGGAAAFRQETVSNSWTAVPAVELALFGAWSAGFAVRSRRARIRQLRARAEDLERDRDRQAALAAATERARISREVHDVVAHGLAVIVIQAQVAGASLDDPPEPARAALDAIVAIGRDSLADLRRVLAAVGEADDADGGADQVWQPQPGLARLPALLDRMNQAGTAVRLSVEGDPVRLPTSVDRSVFRIVQEALTNTVKHAGAGARAEIVLDYGASEISVEIRDDGRGSAATVPDSRARGLGLPGMRERVRLLGGRFSAGPGSEGGFGVRATLPLRQPDREPRTLASRPGRIA